MGFTDNEGKPGNFAEQYNSRREHHLSSLQQKEEEMRQKFVIRVKEKEAELKEAEKEVISAIIFCDLPKVKEWKYFCCCKVPTSFSDTLFRILVPKFGTAGL